MSHSHGASTGTPMSSNSTDDGSMSSMMMMKTYLHFTTGDTLIFDTIVPSSPGAIVGACIILFLLSVLDKWLCGFRRRLDTRLNQRTIRLVSEYGDSTSKFPLGEQAQQQSCNPKPNAKFVLSHALVNGGLTAIESTLHYLLMLVVMTFNASYIISVILGAVVGDMAFRRFH